MKKIIILLGLFIIGLLIFVIFFWDIPAPDKKIEKNLDIRRLQSEKNL